MQLWFRGPDSRAQSGTRRFSHWPRRGKLNLPLPGRVRENRRIALTNIAWHSNRFDLMSCLELGAIISPSVVAGRPTVGASSPF